MTIQFKWKINQLERDPLSGVVKTAHWDCFAIDEETKNYAHRYGSSTFKEVNPENFIPFVNLQQQTVLDWIWEDNCKQIFENSIAQEIELKNTPPTIQGIPWDAI